MPEPKKHAVKRTDAQRAAENVSAGSEEMSGTAETLSQGSTEQAASVEEISSSIEQMTVNSRQNADNAVQTEKIAQKVAMDTRESGKAVNDTVLAMTQIAKKIGVTDRSLRRYWEGTRTPGMALTRKVLAIR